MRLHEINGKKPVELAKELFKDVTSALIAADIEHVDDITTINVSVGIQMSAVLIVLPQDDESELRARLLMRELSRLHWINSTEQAVLGDMIWVKGHVKQEVESRFISLLDGLMEEFMARITAAKAIEQQNRHLDDLVKQVLTRT